MKRVLTTEHEQYIRENYLLLSCAEMGKVIPCPKGTVKSFLYRENLRITPELAKEFRRRGQNRKTTSTPKIDKVLTAKYLTVNVNQLAIKVKKSECFVKKRLQQLGLFIPAELREERKLIGRIKAGQPPPNKGKKQMDYMTPEQIAASAPYRFKKGNLPHNTKTDSEITVRSYKMKDGSVRDYKWIRISLAKWKQLHVYNWEAVNGAIPDGFIVVFRNGDSLNCDIENLELISRAENMARNTIQRYPEELQTTMKILSKLKKAIHEKQDH